MLSLLYEQRKKKAFTPKRWRGIRWHLSCQLVLVFLYPLVSRQMTSWRKWVIMQTDKTPGTCWPQPELPKTGASDRELHQCPPSSTTIRHRALICSGPCLAFTLFTRTMPPLPAHWTCDWQWVLVRLCLPSVSIWHPIVYSVQIPPSKT